MIPAGMTAPIAPISMPSITKGALTKKSVAPTYFMMAISSLLTDIPIVTVLEIRNTDTRRSTAMIPTETYVSRLLNPLSIFAVISERFTLRTPSIPSR